jgi:hypothetical protein
MVMAVVIVDSPAAWSCPSDLFSRDAESSERSAFAYTLPHRRLCAFACALRSEDCASRLNCHIALSIPLASNPTPRR